MLKINVITLFPELFTSHLANLPFKKAISNNVISINLVNLRDYAIDSRGTVDDKPYGGGAGMILMIEPIFKALSATVNQFPSHSERIIVLSPAGKKFSQKMAVEFSHEKQLTLICGRYEGLDARVEQYSTDVVSIGDYVLSGGELPALVLMESITRLLPNVLGKKDAIQIESFSQDGYIEYPQYTRPEEFNGLKVPKVLLSGNHKEIEKWRALLAARG